MGVGVAVVLDCIDEQQYVHSVIGRGAGLRCRYDATCRARLLRRRQGGQVYAAHGMSQNL